MADDTYDVFVSYSRADGRHAAEIDSVLRDKGLKTFFDRSNLAGGQRLELAGDTDRQTFVGELVEHVQHPVRPSWVRSSTKS